MWVPKMSSGLVQLDFRRRGLATKLNYGGLLLAAPRGGVTALSVLGSGIDPVSEVTQLRRSDRLGGLIHQYKLAA